MRRVVTWIIQLPAAIFITGMDAFTKALKEMQQLLEKGVSIAAEEMSGAEPASEGAPSAPVCARCSADISKKENLTMIDQDLGGDDLKYVTYSILFTKRDYEATLEQQREFLVNYSTDGASFASRMMMQFGSRPFDRPFEWTGDNVYPPSIPAGQDQITVGDIPQDDRKYLTFVFNVERRLPKQSREYDKEKVRALQGIREDLGEISNKIG